MRARSLFDNRAVPLLVEPAEDAQASPHALGSWATGHRHDLDAWLHRTGAVLFRGFGVGGPQEFRAVAAAVCPQLLDYVGGDSPRSSVAGQVYTSTEFPPHLEIGLHSELSYTRSWPDRLFFCSLVVAESGGETHIADSREILANMEPAVRDRFSDLGVIYKQHLRDDDETGPGKSWQETFETSDRAQVERICADQDMELEWTGRGLRTSLSNPGVITHPISGETCWFNQVDLWHASFDNVKEQEDRSAAQAPSVEALGSHACYGDGSEIPVSDLQSVRASYRKSEILFPWRTGDLLILDNLLAMHGRKPFDGARRVLVAMA